MLQVVLLSCTIALVIFSYIVIINESGYNIIPGLVYGTLTILEQLCGDANGDDQILVSDAIYLIGYLLQSGSPPPVDDCCDPPW